MIIDYKVVVAESPEELAIKVREEIKGGWEPIGGIAISTVDNPKSGKPIPSYLHSIVKNHRGMLQ